MTYGKFMNDLAVIAQDVWSASDVESKRVALKRAVSTFKYKAKQDEFIKKIATATAEQCDFIASNLALNKTDKVVELLKR